MGEKMMLPLVVTTAPEKIYLQVADDTFYRDETFPSDYGDNITWCADSVVDCEVEYIRADLATPAQTVDVERTFAGFRIVENADVPNGEIWVYDKSKITTETLVTKVKP